jgi:hypothetical protein
MKERIQKLFNIQPQVESEPVSEVLQQSSNTIPSPVSIPDADTHFDNSSFDFLKASLPKDHIFNTMSSREISDKFEAAAKEFQVLYPTFNDFLNKKLSGLTDPYKNTIQDKIQEMLTASAEAGTTAGSKAHSSEVAYGVCMVINDLIKEMLFRTNGPGAIMSIIESLSVHKKIDDMFPDDSTTDELTVILGLISASMQRLSHMVAHVQIEKMAGLHDGL